MSLRWKDIHDWVFLGGIFLIVAGIPVSHFLMSVGGLAISANWLLEGGYRRKFKALLSHKAALVFLSIYFLHALGMLYTQDIDFGLKDLRIKLPFLALPIILASSRPLKANELRLVLMAFVAAVAFGSFRSLFELLTAEVTDVRQISVYISHIRFALSVCLAIFILGYSVFNNWFPGKPALGIQVILILWLGVFLFLLQSFTGLMVMGGTSVLLLLIYGWQSDRRDIRMALLSAGILLPLLTGAYIYSVVRTMHTPQPVDFGALEQYSEAGSFYHHDTLNQQTVNGHYMWLYLAEDELKEAWEGRSSLDFYGNDLVGHDLRDIIIRYLTSKGLRKDSTGLASLSDAEIRLIEQGTGNARCGGLNVLKARICQIYWEYETYRWTGDPSGHSVLMRWEYWKAAWGIIRHHPVAGVGTGDLKQAFAEQYDHMGSTLDPEWRLRSHNQYLSIFAAFGAIGLFVFLIALFLPLRWKRPPEPMLFSAFFIIALLSMTTEDTMESQAGATFIAFFYCLLLLRAQGAEPDA